MATQRHSHRPSPLRSQQVLAYRVPFLFRQLLQPLPHRLASHERTKKDQRDFPRLRVIRHPVPYLVHCTLNCAAGFGGCCPSGRQQGMGLRLRTRRSHSCPAPYSENRILESIVEADAINCYFGVLSTPPRCVAASSELRRTLGASPSYTLQGSRWPVIRPLRPTRLQDVGAEGGGACRPRDDARSGGNLGLEHVDPVKRRSR